MHSVLVSDYKVGVARCTRVWAAVLLVLWLVLGVGVAAATATTETEETSTEETSSEETASEVPLLSITVQNSIGEVESGDEVTYTAVLENLGTSTVVATVVLSAPEYVALVGESAVAATVSESGASWVGSVEGNSSAEFTIDAVIGTIPDVERRVTTVVSVFVGDPAELIVRTADAASIVGVEDLPNDVAQGVAEEAAADDRSWLIVGLIAAAVVFVVLLIVATAVVRSRRSRPTRASGRRARAQ